MPHLLKGTSLRESPEGWLLLLLAPMAQKHTGRVSGDVSKPVRRTPYRRSGDDTALRSCKPEGLAGHGAGR